MRKIRENTDSTPAILKEGGGGARHVNERYT